MEPLPWLFWSGSSFSEPLWILLEQGLLLEPPWFLLSFSGSIWGGDSNGAPLAPLGAETAFRALLALLERRHFFRAPLVPLGTETPFLEPFLAPLGAETPSEPL